jgi:hypothetical protein
VKRRAVRHFGDVLHLMHERWKWSVSLTGRLGHVFTIIKWFLSLLLFFTCSLPFATGLQNPSPLLELSRCRCRHSSAATVHAPPPPVF